MADPPPPIAARRARKRQRRRRRRIITTCVTLAVVAGAAVAGVAALRPSGHAPASPVSVPQTRAAKPTLSAPASPVAATPAQNVSAAASAETIQRLVRLGRPIYCAGPTGNAVAFTFDDGPGPYTGAAIRKLARTGERATFFVVGRSMNNFPGYLPRELNVAAIGDHTFTHPQLTALPASMVTFQLEHTAQMIHAQSGEHVELFRPPYGLHNAVVDRIAQHLGLLEILWNVDSADSLGANWAQIIKTVEAGLRPGAIILMHENHGQTMRALDALIPILKRRHLRSVSIAQLLAIDPPSTAQVLRGEAGCGLTGRVADAS